MKVSREALWPRHCRAALAATVRMAAAEFPHAGEDGAERIHDVRKSLKRARAIARLLAGLVGEEARAAVARLGETRRQVARARDLDVMPAALAALKCPKALAEALQARIGAARDAARRAHHEADAEGPTKGLEALADAIDGWRLAGANAAPIVAAARRTYAEARRRGRDALASENPVALHRFRSRVVDLRYQLGALAPAWRAVLTAEANELNALRQTLGDFNDLTVLVRFASAEGALSEDDGATLAARVAARQAKLLKRARLESARLFVEKPQAFARRLAAYLDNPQHRPRGGGARRAARKPDAVTPA